MCVADKINHCFWKVFEVFEINEKKYKHRLDIDIYTYHRVLNCCCLIMTKH